MNFDRFLQIFVTKETKFFPLFIRSAENMFEAASLLVELTRETDPDQRDILAKRIKERETAGDHITDKIIDELMNSYVTPFDRDDIHALAQDLDTVLDDIRDAAKKIAIYQPDGCDRKLVEIALLIRNAGERMVELTKSFATMRDNLQNTDDICDRIKEIEHVADDVYASYMSSLFHDEKNPVEIIKKKGIMQALEDTCDAAKDVSDTVRGILVKIS